ncbi:MAG: N-6 DNA methylase, partial [Armatimonadota bacterium]|nr:N-6 DNA methylase [Armatimonadota bacterium]
DGPAFRFTEGTERRSTGSYYTPPDLVADLVEHALGPVLAERLRQAKDREARERAVLSIRVLDPAVGSGHFLLAAARRLARELARIRTGEDEPPPEVVREAVRDVISHCIYGVDKNPLAVELCKVALWIESQVAGKPLTFLDHRIRCGDSLVGIVDLKALEQGIPDEAYERADPAQRKLSRRFRDRNRLERAGQLSLEFTVAQDRLRDLAHRLREVEELRDDSAALVAEKARRYDSARNRVQREELACHLWTAAFFWDLSQGDGGIPTTGSVRACLRGSAPVGPRLAARGQEVAFRRRFFHWPLEFPDVFAGEGRSGFDVVLGNPPFMGGLRISGQFGEAYRRWLEVAYDPFRGTADLCAAFYRRAFELLRPGGRLGMVATNTLGQGDTRESGLAVILQQGGAITFARRFIKWPGAANVEVNLVAIRKPDHSPLATRDSPTLDGQPVPFISSRLDHEPEGDPKRLPQNEGRAFQGDIVRGLGFVLDAAEAEALLAKDPRNADCLFPYLNGEDLNSYPEQKPSRWVICFHDWGLERARRYPDLLRIVDERVKPERERLRGPGDARNREYWWQFGAYRTGMRHAIAPLRRVLVRALTSEMHMMAFVPNGWIYSHAVGVFAFDDDYHFALLQSSVHEVWLRKQASSLRTDIRYTPTDCFDTFPFPEREYKLRGDLKRLLAIPEFAEATRIGAEYHEHRRQIMLARRLGLTKTYNLFHDPHCNEADIVRLRELHAEMDRAILACHGWSDIELGHGFYQNDRGQARFTASPEARRELLARLLALNKQIAGKQGNAT